MGDEVSICIGLFVKGGRNMATNTLIRTIRMECPLCDNVHEIEERRRKTRLLIKGEEVEYDEIYYYCCNSAAGENEFETGKMSNTNLLNARNAFRIKHNLLTSDEIVEIRERYGLSQVELAKLLGWGESTISRYESKAIQDEAYDNMLRIIKDNPLKTLEFFNKNCSKFSALKRMQIWGKIIEKIENYGKEFLSRQSLESEYVLYTLPSDVNGNTRLNIDKIESIVSYYAGKVANLYKVKLMKMLWYADALFFQVHGKSITGLVYRHEKMGALPIGHNRLMNLENINMQEEDGYDGTMYHFYKNDKQDMSCLNKDEILILDKVIDKFMGFSSQEIVAYMHDETAYTETKPGEIISFSLAKDIRAF